MKKIKINFCDFQIGFDIENNLYYKILSEKYDVEISDNPDYLFCSVFGQRHLKYDCVKIFISGECQSPDFNLFDYSISFDKIEFGDRHLSYFYNIEKWCKLMEEKHQIKDDTQFLNSKTRFCSFVVSNNYASSVRTNFFEQLSKYKLVDSGGRYKNNIGGPVIDKFLFEKKHKFSLCFENTRYPGYITEKIVQAFAAQTIPIYWGDPNISSIFNPNSFVDFGKYSSIEDAIQVIQMIDNDDEKYLEMIKTPALLNSCDSVDFRLDKLRCFLYNIFDQPLEKAFRRERTYWGHRYLQVQRRHQKSYSHSLYGVLEKIYENTLNKWGRKNQFIRKIERSLKKLASPLN